MKILLLILFFAINTFLITAQELVFGDSLVPEKGMISYQMPDESFWLIGASNGGTIGGGDIFTVRVAIDGTILTPFAYYGTINHDAPNNMILKDGQFIIVGETHDANGVDGFVLIIDTSGTFSSFQVYGLANQSEQFWDIIETNDGGFLVTGFGATASSVGADFLLSKFDVKYNQVWLRIHDLGTNDVGMTAVERADGGFVMVGDQLQAFGGFNVAVIGCDSMGFLEWTKVISYPYNGGCKAMVQMGNQLLIVGEIATPTSAYFDIYLARIDFDGNTLWQGTIPLTDEGDAAFDVVPISSSEFLITGYAYGDSLSGTDICVMRVDTNGLVLADKRYHKGLLDIAYDIKIASNGHYYLTGFTNMPVNQIYLVWDTFSIITPIVLVEKKLRTSPAFFPNPTQGLVWLAGDFANCTVELVDNLGRSHYYQKEGQTLDISPLAQGTYFAIFRDSKGLIVHTDKLIKN